MGSDSKKFYGAEGRGELLLFDPNSLVIVSDKKHPLYDERATMPIDERLIDSIMKSGVLEPVIVRRNGEDEKGRPIVEVVDGRQRVRAAMIANHRISEAGGEPIRVPAITKRGDGGDLMGIMITTNEIRKQDPPLIKAKKVQRYLDLGRSLEEAAVTFGATVTTLKGYLALLDCHPDVIKAVDGGRIGVTHARTLSALPQEKQSEELEKLLDKHGTESAVPLAERVQKAVGGRGKIRKREQKTKKDIQRFRLGLEASKSQDAPLVIAVLDWVLGDEEAIAKYRAIASRIEGDEAMDA